MSKQDILKAAADFHQALQQALNKPRQPNPAGQFFDRLATGRTKRANLPPVIKAVLDLPLEFFKAQAELQAPADAAPLTNVAFVLDRSSSMAHGKSTTIEGFNRQLQMVREGAKQAGRTTFTEAYFSDEVSIRRVASSLEDVADLNDATYQPNGWTALFDALGDTVAALLGTEDIGALSTATLVTLFTDGEENSSSRYDAEILSELIKRLEATGRWTFALVGPRNGVGALADLLSVKRGNVAGYDPTSVAERTQVFGAMVS